MLLSQCRMCDKSQKKFRLTQYRTKHSSGMKLVVKISREKMSVYQASIDIPPHPLMVLIVVKHIVRNTDTVLYSQQVSIPFQVLSMAPVPTLDCLQLRAAIDFLHILPQCEYCKCICHYAHCQFILLSILLGWMMNRSGDILIFVKIVPAVVSDLQTSFSLNVSEKLSWHVFFCGNKMDSSHCQLLSTHSSTIQSGQ